MVHGAAALSAAGALAMFPGSEACHQDPAPSPLQECLIERIGSCHSPGRRAGRQAGKRASGQAGAHAKAGGRDGEMESDTDLQRQRNRQIFKLSHAAAQLAQRWKILHAAIVEASPSKSLCYIGT